MFEHIQFFDIFADPYGAMLWHGIELTAVVTLASWLIAVSMGLLIALMRISGIAWLSFLGSAYVSYQQNIPILVHIMFWYFGVPVLLPDAVQAWINVNHGELIFSSIAIGLCLGAYMSESLRSGFRAVSGGQYEAARSLGFGYASAMKNIIVPQAFRAALPAFVNNSVLLFKNTSLAMAIGAAEMTYTIQYIQTATFRTIEVYLIAAVFYISISIAIMMAGSALERRLDISRRAR